MATPDDVRRANVSMDDDNDPASAGPLVNDAVDPEIGGLPAGRPADGSEASAEEEAEASVAQLRAAPSLFDQERDAIGERYAARRRAELGMDEPAADAAAAARTAETTEEQPAAPDGSGPRLAEDSTPRRYKLKVNGAEIEMDEAEMIRVTQESLAAGLTLDEAKRIRDGARDAAKKPTPAGHQGLPSSSRSQTTDRQNDPARPTPGIDPAQLRETVERLQVGTPEEGAEALESLLTKTLAAQAQQPVSVDVEVERVLSVREANKEATAAMDKFKTNFKELAEDDFYTEMVVRQTAHEIVSDFERIGVPKADIEAARRDPAVLLEAFRDLRTQVNPKTGKPWGLRNTDQIVQAAAGKVAVKVGLRTQATQGAEPGTVIGGDRSDRKAGLTQQPRAGGLPTSRGNGAAAAGAPPPRQSGSEVVQEQRRLRGFT
jgi:hypothetical protein